MPVILGDKESVDTWLDSSSSSNFEKLLKPYEGPDLVSNFLSSKRSNRNYYFLDAKSFNHQVWYPVTPAMGKVSFNGPECSNEV